MVQTMPFNHMIFGFNSEKTPFLLYYNYMPWYVLYWSIVVLCGITQFPSRYLSEKVERVQKRAFRIILPSVHYKEALGTLDCLTLAKRRANLCLRTVKNIYKEGGFLSRHLPLDKTHSYNTRNCNSLNLIPCRTCMAVFFQAP